MKRGQKEFVEKIAKLDNESLYKKLKRNVMVHFTNDEDEPQDWFDRQLIEEFEQRLKGIGFFNGKNV
jgi:hypothetical protein